jgi:hypothetical protein
MVASLALTASLLLVSQASATLVFRDDFDDGVLDPAWTIVFDGATSWTYDESATEPSSLTVTDVAGAGDSSG